ncbi:MAG: EscN/YscN/HrcN family type III secretion system ATPase [Bdellovibrionales bacterium]|nr:EscN/YscN/HrcN family type III secretion system ATPase [Bdellovibrionales bacterium]
MNRPALATALEQVAPGLVAGRITGSNGTLFRAAIPGVALGDMAVVVNRYGREFIAETVALHGTEVLLSTFQEAEGVIVGGRVTSRGCAREFSIGENVLGSILGADGEILRNAVQPRARRRFPSTWVGVSERAPCPLLRATAPRPLRTQLRVFDAFTPVGIGQRLGIFAEPGVGKSSLLAALARHASADIKVIALIGERGREIAEAAEQFLAVDCPADTVIVACSSAEPAVARIAALQTATRIAEYFRDQQCDVLLLVDSLTRAFRAYRELGLAAGELPVRQGYPPSVFAKLPPLIERAGATMNGSITAIYTILQSSDFDQDPLIDEVRGLLDGHVVLSRKLAEKGHYPAVDVLRSLSRFAPRLLTEEETTAARLLRRYVSDRQDDEEFSRLGGKPSIASSHLQELDARLDEFLQQELNLPTPWEVTRARLLELGRMALATVGETASDAERTNDAA